MTAARFHRITRLALRCKSSCKRLLPAAPPAPRMPTSPSSTERSNALDAKCSSLAGTRHAKAIRPFQKFSISEKEVISHGTCHGNGDCYGLSREHFHVKMARPPPHLLRFAGGALARIRRNVRHHSDPRLHRRDGSWRQAHHGVSHHRARNR